MPDKILRVPMFLFLPIIREDKWKLYVEEENIWKSKILFMVAIAT